MPRWPQRDPDSAGGRAGRPLTEAERIGRRNGIREASRHAEVRRARTRRDRPRDPHELRVPFEERKRLALEDLATYRAVSFRDLSDARFGGNDFAARRGISQMQEAGLVVRGKGWGPRGRPFLIFAATAAGTRAAAQRGPADQRRWHGLVKPSEAHHDTAVYRAAREKIAELEGQGCKVVRIRIDAELKSELTIRTPSHRARADNLSGGNQQKVVFAKWLNRKPEILILDEPTRGVDVGAKREIGELVESLADSGSSVLLVTSEIEEMVALADRVAVIRDGVIASEAKGESITEADAAEWPSRVVPSHLVRLGCNRWTRPGSMAVRLRLHVAQ